MSKRTLSAIVSEIPSYHVFQKEEVDKRTQEKIGERIEQRYHLTEFFKGQMKLPPLEELEFKQVEATPTWPAHVFVKVYGINIHLAEGIMPDEEGWLVGRFQVNCRRVSLTRPNTNKQYFLNVTVLPMERDGELAERHVVVSTRNSDRMQKRAIKCFGVDPDLDGVTPEWNAETMIDQFGGDSNGSVITISRVAPLPGEDDPDITIDEPPAPSKH